MSSDKIIASIPKMSAAERDTVRQRAKAQLLASDGDKDAEKVIAALDAFEQRMQSEEEAALNELRAGPPTKLIKAAFENMPPTQTEIRIIQVLIDNPDSSCAELSGRLGWQPNTWDMQFGSLCALRRRYFGQITPADKDMSENLSLLLVRRRDESGTLRYTFSHDALEAFRMLPDFKFPNP